MPDDQGTTTDRIRRWASRGVRQLGATARRTGRGLPFPAVTRDAGATEGRQAVRRGLHRFATTLGLRGWRAGFAAVVTGALVAFAVAASMGGSRLMPGPAGPNIIGFYQNGWSAMFRSSFQSVRSHHRYINTVLAFWYSVDGNGNLHAHQPKAGVTQWIQRHRMRMGVLINNIAGSSGDNAGMLRTAATRHKAVQAIAQMVRTNHYEEVNIDFELLPSNVRSGLTAFMADLRKALPPGTVLSESVFPKVGVTSDINGAYDYTALAASVDYLVIMLYDKNSSGGPAGPVSPYSWVTANMHWFLHTAKIPARKIVLAAGVYGYDWPVGQTNAAELPLSAVTALRKAQGAKVHVDPVSRNPYFKYTDSSGTPHVVWYQDAGTVRQRLDLARRLGLHGVAIWALGQETPPVWNVIEQTVGPKS